MHEIGFKIIYFHENLARTGIITDYDQNTKKHQIKLHEEDDLAEIKIWIPLKSRYNSKQLIIIKNEVKLENIMNPLEYLKLYLSPESPRSTAWKPIHCNDRSIKDKDPLEYHASPKSYRWDWRLNQKFAYAQKVENVGFLRMMVGVCYELENGSLIWVKDVINSNGTQLIKYCKVLKFRI